MAFAPRRAMRRFRASALWLLGGLLLVLAAARAATPWALARYVDRVLDRTKGYSGRVGDIDLALWRGGYRIEGLRLDRTQGGSPAPLLRVHSLDLTIRWSSLWHGDLVGEVVADRPVYTVVAAPPASPDALSQSGSSVDFTQRLDALFPFELEQLEIRDGEIHYRNPHLDPPVDVRVRHVRLLARHFGNVKHPGRQRPASAWLVGEVLGAAPLAVRIEADPTAREPDFHLTLRAQRIPLPALNDLLQARLHADVRKGTLGVYAELDASGGRISGYVKALVHDLDVLGDESPQEGWLSTAWEALVGTIAEVFENQPTDQQATRVPIEGRLDDWSVGSLQGAHSALWNAFVEALRPGLDPGPRAAADERRP
jgi:Domain of Unknown Function (DUF748)